MLHLARAIVEVVSDLVKLAVLFLRPASAIRVENLALRRQLAAYIERGVKPRRLDHAGRVSLSVLSRLFSWRNAIVIVSPSTVIRWHRLGWRIFWQWKSRPGRPRIPLELQRLICRMAGENPLWGEERIANELLVNVGIRVSPRTVRKYMPKRPSGVPRGEMENRIKEAQLGLFADRTSCHYFVANQFRLLLASLAYILMERLRYLALAGTEFARLQASTLRAKLLKIGAVILRDSRRVRVLLSSAYPY